MTKCASLGQEPSSPSIPAMSQIQMYNICYLGGNERWGRKGKKAAIGERYWMVMVWNGAEWFWHWMVLMYSEKENQGPGCSIKFKRCLFWEEETGWFVCFCWEERCCLNPDAWWCHCVLRRRNRRCCYVGYVEWALRGNEEDRLGANYVLHTVLCTIGGILLMVYNFV